FHLGIHTDDTGNPIPHFVGNPHQAADYRLALVKGHCGQFKSCVPMARKSSDSCYQMMLFENTLI
ncbi:MAG: hypothetical protein ABFR65_08725, partial [Pseudomonadota bacterium]